MLEVTPAIFIANLLHATVPLGFSIILIVLQFAIFNPSKNRLSTSAAYIGKALYTILAFYGVMTAYVGGLLLTNLDNVSTIIGNNPYELVKAVEALHGALPDVDIPQTVDNFDVRDVHSFGNIGLVCASSIFISYYFATSLPVMAGNAIFLSLVHGLSGYLIQRAFTVEQIIFWSIVGAVGLLAHQASAIAFSRIDWKLKNFWVWFPSVYFIVHAVGLWATIILANPIVPLLPLAATEWIFPGFPSVFMIVQAVIVYFTLEARKPGAGWSWNTIFYGTLGHWKKTSLPTTMAETGSSRLDDAF